MTSEPVWDESGFTAGCGSSPLKPESEWPKNGAMPFTGGVGAGPIVDDRPAPERRGEWMQTFTGRVFWPMDPRADEVEIDDIAHALAMQCRYAGHCLRFYSVAEHCVLLSQAVAPEHALWALLHDASEAYLVDLPRPVKPFIAGYRDAEARVMAAVEQRFGLGPMPAAVKDADDRILADERAQNMAPTTDEWRVGPPLGVTLHCWSPREAERAFLSTFCLLAMGQAACEAAEAYR